MRDPHRRALRRPSHRGWQHSDSRRHGSWLVVAAVAVAGLLAFLVVELQHQSEPALVLNPARLPPPDGDPPRTVVQVASTDDPPADLEYDELRDEDALAELGTDDEAVDDEAVDDEAVDDEAVDDELDELEDDDERDGELIDEPIAGPVVVGPPLAEIMSDPEAHAGQIIEREAQVAEIPSDHGFYIEEEGTRAFVLLDPLRANPNAPRSAAERLQDRGAVHIQNAQVILPERTLALAPQLDQHTREIIGEERALLLVRPDDVAAL